MSARRYENLISLLNSTEHSSGLKYSTPRNFYQTRQDDCSRHKLQPQVGLLKVTCFDPQQELHSWKRSTHIAFVSHKVTGESPVQVSTNIWSTSRQQVLRMEQ